jgi:hypothetical protein
MGDERFEAELDDGADGALGLHGTEGDDREGHDDWQGANESRTHAVLPVAIELTAAG